jgi:flagellar hook-associated protein 2
LRVERDAAAAETAVRDFVDAYNELTDLIADQTRFDAGTSQGGVLLGNRSVSSIQDGLRSILIGTVPGVNSQMNRLSQVGVELTESGKLTVNAAKLTSALRGEVNGVDSRSVKRLFALDGQASNANMEFLLGSTRTKSSSAPYEVDITQAAEQANATGTNALTDPVVINNTNNQFQINVNGTTSEVLTLSAGTYTRSEFADHVQATINSSIDLGVHNVVVSLSDNKLKITSESYGSKSQVSNVTGSAASALGFVGTESGNGKDVVGRFIVDGQIETAKGTGRLLVGDPDNENTADLQLRVTLNSSQVNAGVEGTLQISRGVTSLLDQHLGKVLDPVKGAIKAVTDGFQQQVDDIDKSVAKSLLKEFSALESILNQLQTTSSFISGQLASLSSVSRRK